MQRPLACALALALAAAACGRPSSDAPPAAPEGGAPPAAAKPAETPKPAPDPTTDAAAWKALPAAERTARAAAFVAAVAAGDPADVERARAFLAERGETDALAALAKAALAAGSTSPWAHQAVGDVDLAAEVSACLAAAELAADAHDAKHAELAEMRARKGGTWWAGPEETRRVRALCAEVKAADELLSTPYGQGVSHWASWQRAIEVMKDSPAVHGARAPYMIFVSLDPDRAVEFQKENMKREERHRRVPALSDLPAADVEKGRRIVERNLDLMARFYDGWMTELGPIFGFTRYDEENSSDKTLLKMNVFTKAADYKRYNDKVAPGMNEWARAYYVPREPRFITTYEGEAGEDPYTTAQVQCHEATHQIMHFYTWDLTSKDLGREASWDDCHLRPAWSEEGFAEFFSSFKVKDGKYLWMQPLDSRMFEIWLLSEIAEAKGWRPWELKEFLVIRNAGGMREGGAQRANRTPADRELAQDVMMNLYYGKSWSLMYFLWYAEEGGRPKYRDRFVEFKKAEFHVTYKPDPVDRQLKAQPIGVLDFRRILGLTKDDALAAFEKEWLDFETKLIEANKKPHWDASRLRARKNLGIK